MTCILKLMLLSGLILVTACSPKGSRVSEAPARPALASVCRSAIAGQELFEDRLVILGETHGTSEIPEAFAAIVCRAAETRPGATVLVGLEVPSGAQAALDAYLGGPGGDAATNALLEHAFWRRDYQDGRSSRAMLALIEELRRQRAAGLGIVVRAIDADKATSAGERDARMAQSVIEGIEAHHPAQTLVLAGDVHSRVLRGYPWDAKADYLPLGAHLRAKYPDALGLHVVSAGGSAWMCFTALAADCGEKPVKPREVGEPIPRIELDAAAEPSKGWSGTLYVGTLRAAAPARPVYPTGSVPPSSP